MGLLNLRPTRLRLGARFAVEYEYGRDKFCKVQSRTILVQIDLT